MSHATNSASRVMRPRFSLLTTFLLLSLAACGVTVWQLWREVEPLRQEIRRLKVKFGYIDVVDPTRTHVRQAETRENDRWQWSVYLPPRGQYSLNVYSGRLPDDLSTRPDKEKLTSAV
jgi:hypothetical protein